MQGPCYKLFNFFLSTPSWRVRIALNLKKQPYEYISIDILEQKEHKSLNYKEKNPFQRVPCLQFRNHFISSSSAIIQFLEESHPNPSFYTNDSIKNAKIREFCDIINSGMQPMHNFSVIDTLREDPKFDLQKWLDKWLYVGFESLEKTIQEEEGKYCFGDQVTLADIFLYPQINSMKRYKIDTSKYQRLNLVNDNLNKIEQFYKAGPIYLPMKQKWKNSLKN